MRVFTLFLALVLLIGCDEISNQVNRYKDNGSVRAVDTCIQLNGSKFVKVEVTRAQCAKKISKAINVEVELRAALNNTLSNDQSLTLDIKGRNTSDYVLTSFSIYVTYVDSEGITFASPTNTQDDLWFLPGEIIEITYIFDTDVYKKMRDENGNRACTDSVNTKCVSWVISAVKGLTVVSANQ